jgi:hypothetical protein
MSITRVAIVRALGGTIVAEYSTEWNDRNGHDNHQHYGMLVYERFAILMYNTFLTLLGTLPAVGVTFLSHLTHIRQSQLRELEMPWLPKVK